MGCGCSQTQGVQPVIQFVTHEPFYQGKNLSSKVLRGQTFNVKHYEFQKQIILKSPCLPHLKYLTYKQQLVLTQIQFAIQLQKNTVVLILPVQQNEITCLFKILKLYSEINFDMIFFNQQNEIKMLFISYEFPLFQIQFNQNCYLIHSGRHFNFYVDFKKQQFSYFSEEFNAIISKVVSYDMRQMNLQTLLTLGFTIQNTPFYFDDEIPSQIEPVNYTVISRSLQLRNLYSGIKEGKDQDTIINSIVSDLFIISDDLQDIYINNVKILILSQNVVVLQVISGVSNSFSLRVLQFQDQCRYAPYFSTKITQLEHKFQAFNFNLSKTRQPLFQQNEIILQNLPSLKTKILTSDISSTLKDCINQLLDGINKIAIKINSVEFNQLINIIESEYFELSHISLTYYADMHLITANFANENNSENIMQQSLQLVKDAHLSDQKYFGAYYKDHEIDLLYRIFNFISVEFDQKINYKSYKQFKTDSLNSSQFIQALFTYICQIYGFRSYTVKNSIGAAVSIIQIVKNGIVYSSAVEFSERLFLVSQNQLPFHFPITFTLTNVLNNIRRKFQFSTPNQQLLKKLVKSLIEGSDQTMQASMTNSFTQLTQRSLNGQSGRIDLLERSGKWEFRIWAEGQESFDYFIDGFAHQLSIPNGQIPLAVEVENWGEIVVLNMRFSDPIRNWSQYFLNKSGCYLVSENEIKSVVLNTKSDFLGAIWLNGVYLVIVENNE